MNIDELEILRKKARNIVLIGITLSIVVALILFLVTKRNYFFLFVIGVIMTIIIGTKPKRKFILAFKEVFVLKSLETVFSELNYIPENGLDESIISDTQMMNMGDRYSSNDYISAKYKDINIILSDVHIEKKYKYIDNDGDIRERWVTIFRGKWMIFDFNKNFKANIQLCQKGFGNAKINNWGNELKFKRIMMEDHLFNKKFRLYAQDEHDAFYILTPSLMEKIKNLSNSIKGKILFCFIDNKLHVGLHNNKDSFEPSIFIKINENKIIESITNDIKLITDFVDELDLDNDLFRKEV